MDLSVGNVIQGLGMCFKVFEKKASIQKLDETFFNEF
jgi:hypothetical protein